MREPEKILIIRFGSMGDVLLTTPLIRALRKRLPGAKIDYLIKPAFAPILKGNPNLNRVIELPRSGAFSDLRYILNKIKGEKRYDIILDIHHNLRSWYVRHSGIGVEKRLASKNRLKRWLLINAGINTYGSDPAPMAVRYFTVVDGLLDPPIEPDENGAEIFPEDAELEEARRAVAECDSYIVVAPSAHWPTKRWLPERFAQAGDMIAGQFGARAVLVGAGEDVSLSNSVTAFMSSEPLNLTGKLSLRITAAVIAGAKAFLGNDTGLMHIAGALGKPGIVVFGPTTGHLGYFPYKSKIGVVENAALECRPCTKQGHLKCPKGHFLCMRSVSVEQVVRSMKKVLTH